MTWAEVVDTALKIGLGALIAGGFSYLSGKMNLEKESRRRYAIRRRDMLEKVLDFLVAYDKSYRHQKAGFENLVGLDSNKDENQKLKANFDAMDEDFRVKAEFFSDIEGILLILNETEAASKLEEYRNLADKWYENSHAFATEAKAKELSDIRKDIIAKRYDLMSHIASIYKNE